MNYYMGIDIGTTSTKAVAFSDAGDVLAREEIAYPILHPFASYSEQNPEEILEAVINSIARIAAALPDKHPVLISFSAAMHSVMAVDAQGQPLTNCIIWADNRASDIAEHLRETTMGDVFYHSTGVPIHAMSPLCKLLWLKENKRELFAAAAKFIGVKEYIFSRLFNTYIVDTPVASATGFLNIHSLQWDEAILAYAGIKASQFSTVTSAYHKEMLVPGSRYYQDARLGQVLTTPFIIGGSDGGLANLGSGAVGKNAMAISIGTSSAVRVVTNEVYTDEHMRTFCYHLSNSSYILGGASNNGAVVLQWFKDAVLNTAESHEQLFTAAEKIPAGSNGLLFIPYLMGERAPVWNSHANGVFFGLNITHTRAHFTRAIMEGIVFNVYSIGRVLMEKKKITEIFATGGFTKSPFWLQTLCDMFNCTVHVSGAVESSASGAVILGMHAVGIEKKWKARIVETYEPNALQHSLYSKQFRKFERLYELLKNEMGDASDIEPSGSTAGKAHHKIPNQRR